MSTHARGKTLLVVCLVAAVFVVAAQDQRPPVFRSGVTFVNVDAYPRRDGHLIEGLRAEDFQILEDGKPQKIEAFEFIRTEPNTPDASRRDPNTKEAGDQLAADPRNRVFIIYLDRLHTTFNGAHDARRPLLDFLSRTISATDLFGVMTSDTPAPQLVFGRRLETLEGELTKHFDWGLRGKPISSLDGPPLEAQLEMCMTAEAPSLGDALVALNREDAMATNLEELMVRLRDLRDERKNLLFISEGWNPQPPQSTLTSLVSGALPRLGPDRGGRLGINPQQGEMTNRGWCDQQIGRLANINFEQRFRDLLTQANRANVSFYPIDVIGLRTNMPPIARPTGPLVDTPQERLASQIVRQFDVSRVDILRILAENTDGMAIVNTNDINGGFRKIADDLSAYYLLGYSSTNATPDGRFRRIDVKVNQPGVQISARRGYLAPNAAASRVTSAAASAPVVPAGVTEELGRLSRLRADADLFTYGVAGKDGLDIVAELSSRQAEAGRWSKGADVQAVVTSDGSRGPLTVAGRIEAVARGAVVHVPLVPGDTGPWHVSVRVAGPDGVLEDRLDVAPVDGVLLGAPLVSRGTASARIALRPVADFQFRRTERVHFEWPVLKPLDQHIARVLDRRGQPLPLAATVTEASASLLAVDLTLAPLSEGDYLIELSAGAGAETERRVLAFRVVR